VESECQPAQTIACLRRDSRPNLALSGEECQQFWSYVPAARAGGPRRASRPDHQPLPAATTGSQDPEKLCVAHCRQICSDPSRPRFRRAAVGPSRAGPLPVRRLRRRAHRPRSGAAEYRGRVAPALPARVREVAIHIRHGAHGRRPAAAQPRSRPIIARDIRPVYPRDERLMPPEEAHAPEPRARDDSARPGTLRFSAGQDAGLLHGPRRARRAD
jgi:hypothetical protein